MLHFSASHLLVRVLDLRSPPRPATRLVFFTQENFLTREPKQGLFSYFEWRDGGITNHHESIAEAIFFNSMHMETWASTGRQNLIILLHILRTLGFHLTAVALLQRPICWQTKEVRQTPNPLPHPPRISIRKWGGGDGGGRGQVQNGTCLL